MASGKPLSEPTEIPIFGNQNITNSLSTVNINAPSNPGFLFTPSPFNAIIITVTERKK